MDVNAWKEKENKCDNYSVISFSIMFNPLQLNSTPKRSTMY